MVHRSILREIETVLFKGKSVLLLGPRQTGKTTLLKTIPNAEYFSLARSSTRLEYQKDPSRLEREIMALKAGSQKKRPLIIIDEIQKVPALMDVVQDLVDEKHAQFILTGSSVRKLKSEGSVNFLPGRVITLRMDPFSQREFTISEINKGLLYGALPGVALENDPRFAHKMLKSYVETYLEEEVRAEALVRNLGPFARFLELSAIESGRVLNYSKISKEIGTSIHTIANYYDILVDCMIAERIEPITRSKTRPKLTQTAKVLCFDLGVRRLAANEGSRLIPERMGELFEQWVALELIRRMRNNDGVLRFWRDPSGPEVDWVIDRNGNYIPIEVKWTDTPGVSDAKHLETFINEYPEARSGYVVCRCRRVQQLSAHVKAIPWQELDRVLTE